MRRDGFFHLEGMVRLKRGFSSSPAASQCPCRTSGSTRTGRHCIDLRVDDGGGGEDLHGFWPLGARPGPGPACRTAAPSSWPPLRTTATGSTHLSMFGDRPISTIQPHPCCRPQPLCASWAADLSSHHGCFTHNGSVMLSSSATTARHSYPQQLGRLPPA